MQAAIISDKILFSIAVLRSAAGNARPATSSRAAKTHSNAIAFMVLCVARIIVWKYWSGS